jgi:endogenous inhibitor of DNA gyrase (YacG/DUF329 family)
MEPQMIVEVLCPACGAPLACTPEAQGKSVRCQRCHHTFTARWAAEPARRERPLKAIPVEEPIIDAVVIGTRSNDVLWWRGHRVRGVTVQKGLIVLRPELVAFVPSEESQNVLGVIARGAAGALLPIQTISLDWLRRRGDVLEVVEDLWHDRRADFDRCLMEAANYLGGLAWSRADTCVARSGRSSVMFYQGSAELRGYAPGGPALRRLLEGWRETDPPILGDVIGLLVVSVLPLLLALALFVGHHVRDDIPAWAPLIPLGMAAIVYLAVVLKIVFRKRRRLADVHDSTAGRAGEPSRSR